MRLMKVRLVGLASVLATLPAWAQAPAIKIPAEMTVAPGRLARLTADTAGGHVRWLVASDDADLVPMGDGKQALFCTPKPGRYAVYAWTAAGDVPSEAAKCVITVKDPNPPTPPVPPIPPDAFSADLQALFKADVTPEKAKHAAQLAALYREAVNYADRPEVTTAGDLAARIRTAAATLVPTDALTGLRKRIGEEIARTLPVDGDKPLDAVTRSSAAKLFARIAAALEGLQ
jgi:hypothetical protein